MTCNHLVEASRTLAPPGSDRILRPALPFAAAAVALVSVGYSASLLLWQRLMILTPDELSGDALRLHSSGMLAMPGVGAVVAGVIAQLTSPSTAMTLMAPISITVTLALAPGLAARHKPWQPDAGAECLLGMCGIRPGPCRGAAGSVSANHAFLPKRPNPGAD